MTCDELRPDYPSYALGILDDPERSEISEHLGRQCEMCTAGVASALATVSALSGAVKITEPPKSLRRRVIASVEREPKTSLLSCRVCSERILIQVRERSEPEGSLKPMWPLRPMPRIWRSIPPTSRIACSYEPQ